jgi:hydroxymethylpyrimidine pyrophosphatase-like HAD family hydrolase
MNDKEMLVSMGSGVPMGNAIEEVKMIADYICDTNDNDGVAKWLDENIIASRSPGEPR